MENLKRLAKKQIRPIMVVPVLALAVAGFGVLVAVSQPDTLPPDNLPSADLASHQDLKATIDSDHLPSLKPSSDEENYMQSADSKGDVSSQSVVSRVLVTSTTSGNQTSVHVNGHKVQVPQNGTVHKTITNADGQTSVDINVSGNSQSDATSSTSTSLNLNISSDSSSTAKP